MSNVTKRDLIEAIASKTGLTQVDTRIIVENFFESVSNALKGGNNIEIRGFGRFKLKKKNARIARNPRTGEKVQVEEGFKPTFEASNALRKRVNDSLLDTPSADE
jgi:DNA-binding protein HU-beta/integration host factor subunit beta